MSFRANQPCLGKHVAALVLTLSLTSGVALASFSYDFDSLVAGQTALGQDGWSPLLPAMTVHASAAWVSTGPGINGSDCLRVMSGIAPGDGAWITRAIPRMTYTSQDRAVEFGVQVWCLGQSMNSGSLILFTGPSGSVHLGLDGNDYGPIKTESNVGRGDQLSLQHWYALKLVIDFSMAGASATLYHRDLTTGEASFSQDSWLRNFNLGLIPDSAGSYSFDKLIARLDSQSSGTYMDNIFMQGPQPVPEPATCGALTGLFCLVAAAGSGVSRACPRGAKTKQPSGGDPRCQP